MVSIILNKGIRKGGFAQVITSSKQNKPSSPQSPERNKTNYHLGCRVNLTLEETWKG